MTPPRLEYGRLLVAQMSHIIWHALGGACRAIKLFGRRNAWVVVKGPWWGITLTWGSVCLCGVFVCPSLLFVHETDPEASAAGLAHPGGATPEAEAAAAPAACADLLAAALFPGRDADR